MIAASFWSLLAPALDMARPAWGRLAFIPAAVGFLAGAGVLRLMDILLPHLHPLEGFADGMPSHLPRSALLIFAITLAQTSLKGWRWAWPSERRREAIRWLPHRARAWPEPLP